MELPVFNRRNLEAFAKLNPSRGLRVEARAAADGAAEIFLYDAIGDWGVSAADFAVALSALKGQAVRIRINSPGGDAFAGMAMYELIRQHDGEVEARVDALAASAASYLMLGASRVTLAENATVMIHKAWGMTIGNADEMRATAAILDRLDGQQAQIFSSETGKSIDEIMAALAAETWFTAQEAVDFGIADAIVEPSKAKAALPEGMFAKAPAILVASSISEPASPTIEDTSARDRAIAMRRRLNLARIRAV